MKIKRTRRVKKCLNFYKNNFNFRSPYQVLVDSTFCFEALQCKIQIKDEIPRYLDDPNARLYTTPCVIMEAEGLGHKAYGAFHIVKQFIVRKCGHEKNSKISAEECILSMLANNNSDHFIIATNDSQLINKCRRLAGVPLMTISYNAPNLEKPSRVSVDVSLNKMKTAVDVPAQQRAMLENMKPVEEMAPHRKKRKAKGPNPLSCKKKKIKLNPQTSQTAKKEKK
ncbi:rRNA-processing protein UTP23 homolog [Nephila pilipes]|uniref:rRNA-processing protein UTP23 homolog n=1 Tax=Nephila pilipes TaxID=299642 RepID=A0A8X6K126_NEPPI|nr:rRNA-processing protein UTP23 homolog [Nephila pilipes]